MRNNLRYRMTVVNVAREYDGKNKFITTIKRQQSCDTQNCFCIFRPFFLLAARLSRINGSSSL